MKTLPEQLAELKEARQTKMARMNEIADLVKAESRDWKPEESGEFEGLETEIKKLDGDIRLKIVECMNASTAKEIPSGTGPVYWKKPENQDDKFKGQSFTRMVIARAVAFIDQSLPHLIAEQRWGKTNPILANILKDTTPTAGATSAGSHWLSDLVLADNRYTGDFIEYLAGRTVFDKLPLRQVPANVTVKSRDGAATGYWVAEGAAVPVTSATSNAVSLTPFKVAAICVLSNELLRDSTPSAELFVRDAISDALAKRVDDTFLGSSAGGTGYPAGLMYNLGAVTTNGTDAAALRADVRDLYASHITAKNASGLYFVMNPALAKAIQLLTNALGLAEFPTINQDGGTLLGDPVVTGDNVGSDDLILLKPSEIWRIADTGIAVSISRDASIEMATDPAQNLTPTAPAASSEVVSMFQTESTAIKLVRSVNFQKRRTTAVSWISAASYGGTESA